MAPVDRLNPARTPSARMSFDPILPRGHVRGEAHLFDLSPDPRAVGRPYISRQARSLASRMRSSPGSEDHEQSWAACRGPGSPFPDFSRAAFRAAVRSVASSRT